jgi:hypothetical protein
MSKDGLNPPLQVLKHVPASKRICDGWVYRVHFDLRVSRKTDFQLRVYRRLVRIQMDLSQRLGRTDETPLMRLDLSVDGV